MFIPDTGVKKAPDPGSGSATLVMDPHGPAFIWLLSLDTDPGLVVRKLAKNHSFLHILPSIGIDPINILYLPRSSYVLETVTSTKSKVTSF
jgi:hypothetical protein